jgi:hypothetical protein
MKYARNPQPYRLSFDDAVQVWLLYWAGAYQHVIAARFGVNPGRINEVLKGHRHEGSRAAAEQIRASNDNKMPSVTA